MLSVCPPVCLSVRLSVTRVLCDKFKEPTGDILYRMKGQSFQFSAIQQ